MYRSKESLIALAANKFRKRVASSLTLDRLLDQLIAIVTSDEQEEADVSLVDTSDESEDGSHQQQARGGRSNLQTQLTSSDTERENGSGTGTQLQARRRVRRGRRGNPQQHQTRHPSSPPQQREHTNQVVAPPAVIDEVIQAVLKKSFMKHLKGQAREHCQMGHKLELPIGENFMRDVNENKKLGPGMKIVSLHKVGLVGKRGSPWAKDSIDFIACVCPSLTSSLQLWGIEIKSRQKTSTIQEEKQFMREKRMRKYTQISSKDAYKFIRKRDERFQLLHHAYVYGFNKVALVVGEDGGRILNVTIVSYDNATLESYGKVVEKLKTEVLDWAYDESMDSSDIIIPEKIVKICQEMTSVNCKEALYSTVKLWKYMFDDKSILPRPTIHRILPRSHAKWNTGKPGSDTITKIVDDCFFSPPKCYTNFESKASGRSFQNLSANVLRLCQITTTKADFENSYPTIKHYRDAATHRFTHKQVLRHQYQYFKAEVERLSDPLALSHQEASNQQTRDQSRPQRVRFRGQPVEENLDYAMARTFQTPSKAKKRMIENGKGCKEVQFKTVNCTGCAFEVVDQGLGTKDQRRACYHCGAKTKWQCIKCHFYFCMDYKGTNKRDEHLCYLKQRKNKDSNEQVTKFFGKTCFHLAHENAIRKYSAFVANDKQDEEEKTNEEDEENTNPNITSRR